MSRTWPAPAPGLQIDPEKVYLIESRLTPVARREGFGSIREMLLAARQKHDEKLMWAVVEALAAGETWFFRDRPQFDRFRDEILPALARGRPAGQTIRVWSAGCGCGQEPYSLAFMVEDAGAAVLACGVEILGSDICERALEKAQSGLYSQVEVQRGLPIRQLVRHFEKREDLWEVSPRVRAMVVLAAGQSARGLPGAGTLRGHLLPPGAVGHGPGRPRPRA